ncbi:hypothetical protein NLU13_5054 [Sarocladium strictum]|uniref:Cyclochlorotine biosynthesis protein O n=1 Tax=Sarocladium strictum TaxID=5046 RepID=A0AA39GKQ8_SARSR|nr:hypothetical protein NLU13_5054 [Sarocladium strictum]
MPSQRDYQPLPKKEDDIPRLNDEEIISEPGSWCRRLATSLRETQWPVTIASAASALSLLLTIGLVLALSKAPAQDAIKYHTVIYPDAIRHTTKYMGRPSPELDEAWEPFADELPDEPGYHAVMLDIFHSLHCLNEVRKSLNPEYYGAPSERFNTTEERLLPILDHCVEHIRMALWCNADISPIPFQKADQGLTASHVYTHTCRDRDAILEWATSNRVRRAFLRQ